MSRDILAEIVAKRKADIARLGIGFGFERPKRTRPLHPFIQKPGTILEIKRSSPSKGNIAMDLDPAETARKYAQAGTSAISVLTEGNYFHGSLRDVRIAAENAPDTAILRKDFLLEPEEIDVAYDFGADAVLLIARILETDKLLKMAGRARELGLTPFVEVRTEDDLKKLKTLLREGTAVAGVNARDLTNFHIDPLIPAAFRSELGTNAVFESGTKTPEDAAFARRLGFEGILIGEAAAKSPDAAKDLVHAFLGAKPDRYGEFWKRLAAKRRTLHFSHPGKPLVKVCGITNEEDGILASELGADLLGFLFYSKSPRSTNADDARRVTKAISQKFGEDSPLFVGVVADHGTPEESEALALASEGVLDAVQFHGCGISAGLDNANFGFYEALRLKTLDDANKVIDDFRQSRPRTLLDAYVEGIVGGTGTRIDDALVDAVREQNALWLAGGISVENATAVIERFQPELVDLSSALEASAGKKNPNKLKRLFEAMR